MVRCRGGRSSRNKHVKRAKVSPITLFLERRWVGKIVVFNSRTNIYVTIKLPLTSKRVVALLRVARYKVIKTRFIETVESGNHQRNHLSLFEKL